MSHPNPSHDRDNEYLNDTHPVSSFKSGMKSIRKGLQKVVGHKRRERHGKAKNHALMKMKHSKNKYDVGNNPKGRDEYDSRQN